MFIEMTRGRSFRGLAQYCLHDVDAPTDERVAFVQTANLATNNAQVAWRIMAAKHYCQDQLKAEHGIGRGGRKDGKPVGHLVIGWRNDEAQAQQLDQQQMMEAAQGALKAIGAEQLPAMVIGHTDTEHPHLHVVLCLIAEDGRLKKNWKEREKLSKFALQYELEHHGKPIVETRLENQQREAGQKPRHTKKKLRQFYELDKAAETDAALKEFAMEHKDKWKALQQSKAGLKEQHDLKQDRLKRCLEERVRRHQLQKAQQAEQQRRKMQKDFALHQQELLARQKTEQQGFDRSEQTLKGSVRNGLRMIDWRSVLDPKKEGSSGLMHAFRLLTSEDARRKELLAAHKAQADELHALQQKEAASMSRTLHQETRSRIQTCRERYVKRVAAMQQRQAEQKNQLREQQRNLTRERNEKLESYRQQQAEAKREAVKKQREVSEQKMESKTPAPARQRTRRERKPREPRPPRTKPSPDQPQVTQNEPANDQTSSTQDDFEQRMRNKLHRRRSREWDREP